MGYFNMQRIVTFINKRFILQIWNLTRKSGVTKKGIIKMLLNNIFLKVWKFLV